MKKTIILLLTATILLLTLLFFTPKITANSIKDYSYTKAICNENYCKDYYVECSGKKIKSITPTSFSIQNDENWKDTRENKEINCE